MGSPPTQPEVAAPDVGESRYQRYLSTRYFGSLDGIRCLAIVAVLWHHAAGTGGHWGHAAPTRGFLGVDLFFVLSGFLIATLLLRERDRMNGRIDLIAFYARRTLRIFPIYYLAVALTAGYTFARAAAGNDGGEGTAAFLRELPYFLTFTANWTENGGGLLFHAWSLSVEEQFYLVWPPVLALLAAWAIPAFLLPFLAVNVLFGLGVFGGGWPHLEVLEVTFTPIALGVVMAHLMHGRRGFDAIARLTSFALARPMWLAIVLAISLLAPEMAGWWRLALHLAMAGFVAACVVREDGVLSRTLAWSPVRRVGLVSYGMYLYHMLGLVVANQVIARLVTENSLPHAIGVFVLGSVATYVGAEISFKLIETPLLRYKDRFKPGFRDRARADRVQATPDAPLHRGVPADVR